MHCKLSIRLDIRAATPAEFIATVGASQATANYVSSPRIFNCHMANPLHRT